MSVSFLHWHVSCRWRCGTCPASVYSVFTRLRECWPGKVGSLDIWRFWIRMKKIKSLWIAWILSGNFLDSSNPIWLGIMILVCEETLVKNFCGRWIWFPEEAAWWAPRFCTVGSCWEYIKVKIVGLIFTFQFNGLATGFHCKVILYSFGSPVFCPCAMTRIPAWDSKVL